MEFGPLFRAMVRHRARFLLIVAEVALTLAIVANCVGLILRARADMTRPSGFDEANLIAATSTPFAEAFNDPAYVKNGMEEDLRVLRGLPGVAAASNTNFVPWSQGGMVFAVRPKGTQREPTNGQFMFADPDFLSTLGVHIVQGRDFTRDEYESVNAAKAGILEYQGPVLVSREMADAMFPKGDAVGKTIESPEGLGSATIVGVFDPFFKPMGGEGVDRRAAVYPLQAAKTSNALYLVRTKPGQAAAVAAEIERALIAADDGRNVRVRTIPEIRQRFHAQDRMLVASLDAVMVLLLLVTALGIVGLTSFSVAERRRQIGTRRALGATRRDILRHFLLENWIVTSVGAALGIALALGLNVGLVSWAEGAKMDWRMLAIGVALLWTVGVLSALGPALRAARVPPAIATRNV
jgi:putative ABC transport system permease protein